MKLENPIPCGTAFINGFRIVFNCETFKKGKNKCRMKCYYKKGYGYKSIILRQEDIIPLKD